MAETTPVKQARSGSTASPEDFLVANRAEIVRKLRRIAKAHCVITAFFNGGARSMNTAILDVMQDMELVVIDVCLNETTNQRMLEADRVIFKTDVEGIDVQFAVKSIMKAKFQGQSVFAIPIPERMLWVQRRHSHRISIPQSMAAYLTIENEAGGNDQYRVLDISAGGLAIEDEDNRLDLEPETPVDCHLYLPGHGDAELTLEVRNRSKIHRGKRDSGQRLGCAYVDLNTSFGPNIQRYIHALDILRKRSQD